MKRRSNINFNMAGKVSLVGLSLVACATAFPVVSAATYADDDFPVPAAASGSTVGLAFSKATSNDANASVAGTTVSNSVTPLNENNPVRVNVNLAVTTSNVEKYDLYIGSTSADLKTSGCNSDDCKIAAMTGTSTFANIPKNKWGYSYSKAANSVNDSYSAVPSTGTRATVIDTKTGTNANGTSNYTLSFAANIGSDRAVGTYSNQVTLSVVSTAKQVTEIQPSTTMSGATYLQEVTKQACTGATENQQYQLKDARDGKQYYIAKLKDGNCWMTQNLDFNIPEGGLTSDTNEPETADSAKSWKLSDLTAAWNTVPSGYPSNIAQTIPATIKSTDSDVVDKVKAWGNDQQGLKSWDPGDWYNTSTVTGSNDTAGTERCTEKGQLSDCTKAGFTNASSTDKHRHVGNYYQWCAATAGCKIGGESGDELKTANVSVDSSICPAGWKLPTSNSASPYGQFWALVNSLASSYAPSTPEKLMGSPAYFIYGGNVFNNGFLSSDNSSYVNYGNYWSSTVNGTKGTSAYSLYFRRDYVDPGVSSSRFLGMPVRCILKTS